MPQLSVTHQPRGEFPGLALEFSKPVVLSRRVDASERLHYGIAVTRGSDPDHSVKPLTGPEDEVVGILSHTHFVDTLRLYGETAPVKPGDVSGVLVDGIVAVITEQDVVPGDPVYVRHTAGTSGEIVGQFRKDQDTGKAKLLRGARYVRSSAEGVAYLWFRGASESAAIDIEQITGDISALEVQLDKHLGMEVADPGDAEALPVENSATIALTTAGAETRSLAAPTFVGQRILLTLDVTAGDCVVTVASPINAAGNNTLTFQDAGDTTELVATKVASALVWRVSINDGTALTTV